VRLPSAPSATVGNCSARWMPYAARALPRAGRRRACRGCWPAPA
jgi:hypothetical protein